MLYFVTWIVYIYINYTHTHTQYKHKQKNSLPFSTPQSPERTCCGSVWLVRLSSMMYQYSVPMARVRKVKLRIVLNPAPRTTEPNPTLIATNAAVLLQAKDKPVPKLLHLSNRIIKCTEWSQSLCIGAYWRRSHTRRVKTAFRDNQHHLSKAFWRPNMRFKRTVRINLIMTVIENVWASSRSPPVGGTQSRLINLFMSYTTYAKFIVTSTMKWKYCILSVFKKKKKYWKLKHK